METHVRPHARVGQVQMHHPLNSTLLPSGLEQSRVRWACNHFSPTDSWRRRATMWRRKKNGKLPTRIGKFPKIFPEKVKIQILVETKRKAQNVAN